MSTQVNTTITPELSVETLDEQETATRAVYQEVLFEASTGNPDAMTELKRRLAGMRSVAHMLVYDEKKEAYTHLKQDIAATLAKGLSPRKWNDPNVCKLLQIVS